MFSALSPCVHLTVLQWSGEACCHWSGRLRGQIQVRLSHRILHSPTWARSSIACRLGRRGQGKRAIGEDDVRTLLTEKRYGRSTSAPGLGLTIPHLLRAWARPSLDLPFVKPPASLAPSHGVSRLVVTINCRRSAWLTTDLFQPARSGWDRGPAPTLLGNGSMTCTTAHVCAKSHGLVRRLPQATPRQHAPRRCLDEPVGLSILCWECA